MLCTINDVTVVMPDPGGVLAQWFGEHWPELQSQIHTIVCNFQRRQTGYGDLYGPGWREYPIYKLNSLYWPTGFARRPFGFFLAHDAARTAMLAAGSTPRTALVRLGNESSAAFVAKLNFVCDGLPIVGAPSETPLWLMIVSVQPTTVPYYTSGTWPTSSVAAVAAYQAMDLEIVSQGRMSPIEIADIMGWSHQRRAVTHFRGEDQSYNTLTRWHAASESVTLIDDQLEQFAGLRMAGTCIEDGPVASSVQFRHPVSIQYHSSRHVGRNGVSPRGEWESTYPNSEFTTSFPEVGQLTSFSNFPYTPSTGRAKTLPAISVAMSLPLSNEVGNTSDLEDFHDQWLEDYLLWTSRECSIEYAGIVPWLSTGFDDYTIWETWPKPKTRIVGLHPTARIGLNVAGYAPTFDGEGNGFGSFSMPDLVTAYGIGTYSSVAATGSPSFVASGNWYLRRSVPAGSPVYTMRVDVHDPLNYLPDGGSDAIDCVGILAWFSNRWNIIGIEHAVASVVSKSELDGSSGTEGACLRDYNSRYNIKAVKGWVSVAAEPFGELAARCTSYTGGGGGPIEYDPGPEFDYLGSGTWELNDAYDPADFKDYSTPPWAPPEPPTDWVHFEFGPTYFWYSGSTGYYLLIST